MLLPLTDFAALLGINLVLCAVCLRLLGWLRGVNAVIMPFEKWMALGVFIVLWWPVGSAHLPIVAYIRGVSSDLSMTLVALACIVSWRAQFGFNPLDQRNVTALWVAVAAAALVLYPLALGLGDWDPYRLGWGTTGIWLGLLSISVVCWLVGLRLLPFLIALAVLAWSTGVLESTNLWDYLIDPWLAMVAIFQCVRVGIKTILRRSSPVH